MTPLKTEFLLKLGLGIELIIIDNFWINMKNGERSKFIPKEIRNHVLNITKRIRKENKKYEWSDSFESRHIRS